VPRTIGKLMTLACAAMTMAGVVTAAAPAGAVAGPAAGARAGDLRAACGADRRGTAQDGTAHCGVLYAPQVAVNAALAARAAGQRVPASATTPKGWGATDIEAAYKLPVSQDPHATVAVVIPFSAPDLAADVGAYRSQYGLPACTTASGCLRIVNQRGKPSPLPASGVDSGWALNETLDVSMVSAACPLCKILVVESSQPTLTDLATAEDTAARLGAVVISNSYEAAENGLVMRYAKAYDHPGHTIVAAAGDDGFTAANFPANLATVTAAGGTELSRARNPRGWAEQVWNSELFYAGGSGCSAYVAKPPWQHDPHCGMRTVGDVSAVASDVPVYEKIQGGWLTVSGTSVSAPLIAGIYGLADNAAAIKPGYEYEHPGSLFDITTGNNEPTFPGSTSPGGGAECGFDYLCVAKKGYDAPTGLGTPDGVGAF
jgi:subtilase family serine protease